jgi:hypothetical protein
VNQVTESASLVSNTLILVSELILFTRKKKLKSYSPPFNLICFLKYASSRLQIFLYI